MGDWWRAAADTRAVHRPLQRAPVGPSAPDEDTGHPSLALQLEGTRSTRGDRDRRTHDGASQKDAGIAHPHVVCGRFSSGCAGRLAEHARQEIANGHAADQEGSTRAQRREDHVVGSEPVAGADSDGLLALTAV